ncbi:MAG: hypothetical protein KAX31_00205, partial [Thermoplasmata archaeon]|nr:hypothetical protein [Thermoplasmata archaeon]
VPDISPISEDLNKALEDAGYEEYFAPEVEEITHDYSTPERDHASDDIFASDEREQESKLDKLERMEQPLAEDYLRYTRPPTTRTPTREIPGLAYYGGAPEAVSFAATLSGDTKIIPENQAKTAKHSPLIIHAGPINPNPMASLSILLVDDDNSPNNGGGYNINNVEEPATKTYFQDSLNNLGYAYDLFVVPSGGDGPDLATLQGYDVVIWVFGYIFGFASGPTLTATDQANLGSYLDGGGMLWLDGPLFLYELCGGTFGNTVWGPGDFAYDYMHLDQSATDLPIPTPNPLVGVAGSAEDGNSYATASYWTQFGLENYATECVQQAGALGEYLSNGVFHPECGVEWTNGHKVLYTGAEWTFIVDDGERDASMDSILNFFITADYGCVIDPGFSAQDTTPNSQVDYPLNITNIGIAQPLDLFDLTYISFPFGWTVEFFEDDGVTPLVDNNMDGNPDTNVIPSLGWKNIIARVTVPPGALGGDVDTAILTARSNNNPLYFSQATLETTVPPYGVEWDPISIDGWCRENDMNWFTVTVRNTAGFPDTFDLTSFSPMGWLYSFNETDGTPLVDTGGTPDVDTGIIPPLSEKLIKVRVEVPLGNPPGTIDNAIINATSVGDPIQVANLDLSIFVTYEVIYFEGVEFGEDDYTHYAIEGGPDTWGTSGARSYQDAFSWYSGIENAALADFALESPYIFVPNVNTNYAKLEFWHWYDFVDHFDGGIVECWDAGSQSWAQIFPEDGYDGTISSGYGNPLGGLEGFCIDSGGWQHEYFDILSYLGSGPTEYVVNETVYGPSVGGEMGPLYLDHDNIVDCTLYIDIAGEEWCLLGEGPDYSLNYTTGEIDISDIVPMEADWTFYAYYNYTKGSVVKIAVRVTIPGTAVGDDLDMGIVTATSFNDNLISADTTLETLCYVPGQDYKAVYTSYRPEADVGPVAAFWQDDFEDGDISDWTLGGASNDWEIGTPAGLGGDPAGAFNGTFSIGNDLTGDGQYEPNIAENSNYIHTPAIDCTGYVGVTLEFERWLGVQWRNLDYACIRASNNGMLWTILWENPAATNFVDYEWTTTTYDISGIADNQPTVYVRFEIGPTSSSGQYSGWNIDDISLTGQITQLPESDQLLYNSAIWTGDTGGNVRLAILDSWGTDNTLEWQYWADRHGDIDVVFMDGALTYEELVASAADALVISHAIDREYSDDEIAAIAKYANEGHGLIATGGSIDFGVPNNVNLGPLFGLAAGFQPWPTSFTEFMVDEPLHPVMAGLPNPFSPGSALKSCNGMTLDGAISLAHIDVDLTGMVTAYEMDTIPPTFAGIQTCVDVEGIIDLGWLSATDPGIPITYNIYQALASGAQNFAAPTYTTTELNYQVLGLVNGVEYFYVVRAEDKYGNEDTNTVELSATPTSTRMFLQVQTPGFAGYQNLSLEPLEAALQTKTTDVPAAGNYLVGDVGWITKPSAEPYDLAGNWKFHMFAYVTDPVITGDLFIRCWNYSAGPVDMLFETGKSELVDGHTSWHEFIWTYDVP